MRLMPLTEENDFQHGLANLGWVYLDFGCSTLYLVLPGLMGNWQNWLRARWWNISNQSQPNRGSLGVGSPCSFPRSRRPLTHLFARCRGRGRDEGMHVNGSFLAPPPPSRVNEEMKTKQRERTHFLPIPIHHDAKERRTACQSPQSVSVGADEEVHLVSKFVSSLHHGIRVMPARICLRRRAHYD